MEVPLGHDPERDGAERLGTTPEVQPLVVLCTTEPGGRELDQGRMVQRHELHDGDPEERECGAATGRRGGLPYRN